MNSNTLDYFKFLCYIKSIFLEILRIYIYIRIQSQTVYKDYTMLAAFPWHYTVICDPPCQNGGECVQNDTCSCILEYTGPTCESQLS